MRKLLFLLALLPLLSLHAQPEKVAVSWYQAEGKWLFPQALYADGENTLPYLSRKIPWKGDASLPVVTLEVLRSQGCGTEADSALNLSRLESKPLLEYSLASESGRKYLIIKILPYFLNEAGKAERVEEMELDIGEKPLLAALKSSMAGSWKEKSVLAEGNWYKIAVRENGIHRISYEQLQEMGMENTAQVRIYGKGGTIVPESFINGWVDDLAAIPLWMDKGSDGLFGPGDHLLFYAQGPVNWNYYADEGMYLQDLHVYADQGYYFVTDSNGSSSSPANASLATGSATHLSEAYDYRVHVEDESYNLIESGREWYGDLFNVSLDYSYPFRLPEGWLAESAKIMLCGAGRSGQTSYFQLFAEDQQLGSLSMNGTNLSSYTSRYAYENKARYNYTPQKDVLTLTLMYARPDENSQAWLNYLTVNARSAILMDGDQLLFRDQESAGPGNIVEFQVSGIGEQTLIWDVSDAHMPLNIDYGSSDGKATFKLTANEAREFVAFNKNGSFPAPLFEGGSCGVVANQNLHGLDAPEMVILSPDILLEQAERLAEFRRSNDGLDVVLVRQEEVFNEFSSGTPDVAALRNFMKMFYDRGMESEDNFRYLLLFGDGSYDNRGAEGQQNNPGVLLTYQSWESLLPTSSYVSDDYFGLLDAGEGLYSGLLDIGIGRLPVSDLDEATEVVDKVIAYSSGEARGDWRNQLCFIGDDEDSNIHMRQADELAIYVADNYPSYNINKIYLDAYKQEDLSTGPAYPEVNRAFNGQVNRGALIINYTGHGGTQGLAHEKIITLSDIYSWSNGGKLPLFMTATCEFSRYDEYDRAGDQKVTSAGEEVLLNPNGGGIGLFTTTRLVYSGPNHVLNEHFYEKVFEKKANGEPYRLGDIIAYSKNETGSGINKRNFTLLGDPAMSLCYPEHKVMADSLNGVATIEVTDTLSAFEWVEVAGHMESVTGSPMDDFEGSIYPKVYDKEKKIVTLANDGGSPFTFYSRESLLYSGESSVVDGRFSFSFFVPKDINYSFGPGKMTFYSYNSEDDAHGNFEDFTVGGISKENAEDNEAPVIELYMNDTNFFDGGITDDSPELYVRVWDNYGINTTGNGIGHDLTATLDGDRVNAVILNEFYRANKDSFNSGEIRYPYSDLETGSHSILVKIWDIHNNSSEEEINFVVVDNEEMLIDELRNFPNPFMDETWFDIRHNRPDSRMEVSLRIYSIQGELVRSFEMETDSPGYRLEPLRWDGTGEGGSRLGSGMFVYHLILKTEQGEMSTGSGKLILLR